MAGEHDLVLAPASGAEAVTLVGGWRVTVGFSIPPRWPPWASTSRPASYEGDTGGPTPDGVWRAWLDRASLGGRVYVRTRRPGDRFQPLGMAQAKKLQDFFTDSRVPRDWRDRVPLLVSEGGIAWVVGWRIAHWAKVGAEWPDGAAAFSVTFEQVL